MNICLYVRTMLLDIGIEFEISYMIKHLDLVYKCSLPCCIVT